MDLDMKVIVDLTLNAPIPQKSFAFSSAEMFK